MIKSSVSYRFLGVICCVGVIGIGSVPVSGGISGLSLSAGVAYEHNAYRQFGIHASVAHDRILKGHPRVALMMTSNRLAAVAGKNVLKKENYVCNAGWYFRPGKYLDPFIGVDVGFTRYHPEYEEIFGNLDNSAPLVNARLGLASTLWRKRIRLSVDCGYCFVQSALVFPLIWGAVAGFDIARGVLP